MLVTPRVAHSGWRAVTAYRFVSLGSNMGTAVGKVLWGRLLEPRGPELEVSLGAGREGQSQYHMRITSTANK